MKKQFLMILTVSFIVSGCSWMPSMSSLKFWSDNEVEKSNEELLGVNPYLWQATLTKLSFLPLLSADSKGGVVVTDWSPKDAATGESFKVTVNITSKQLRSDAVDVKVFKRVWKKGTWVEQDCDTKLEYEIEKTILNEARILFRRDVMGR